LSATIDFKPKESNKEMNKSADEIAVEEKKQDEDVMPELI
jgi:hypothetical protein